MEPTHIVVDSLASNDTEVWWGILLGPAATLIGSAGALLGLWFLSRQLRESVKQTQIATLVADRADQEAKAQNKWKKAQHLAELGRAFYDDPKVARVLRWLDYSERKSTLMDFDDKRDTKVLVIQTKIRRDELERDGKLAKYLAPGPNGGPPNSVVLQTALRYHKAGNGFYHWEAVVRDHIDYFLTRLEVFKIYLDAELYSFSEIQVHLQYVLESMAGFHDPAAADLAAALAEYMNRYGYTDALYLVDKQMKMSRSPTAVVAANDDG